MACRMVCQRAGAGSTYARPPAWSTSPCRLPSSTHMRQQQQRRFWRHACAAHSTAGGIMRHQPQELLWGMFAARAQACKDRQCGHSFAF